MNVKSDANRCRLIAAALMLILPPLVLLALGDYPRRSLLKETLSMLTLAAFLFVPKWNCKIDDKGGNRLNSQSTLPMRPRVNVTL